MPATDDRPIVIVDDDADDRFFTERALKKAGVTMPIVACADGRELVSLLEKAVGTKGPVLPSAILLDIKMPHVSGFEALRWIRARAELKPIRVVMLTGSEQTKDKELARSLGADDYRVKYPSPDQLWRALAGHGGSAPKRDPRFL